jgi:hypothetical protein
MADAALLANYQNWMYEMQGAFQKLFPAEFVLLALLSGVIREASGFIKYDQSYERFTQAMDRNNEVFDGSSVRFPLMLAGLPAGGTVAEGGTWNAPGPIDTSKANVNLARVLQPLAVSIDADRDSQNGKTSAMGIVKNYIGEAYKASARIENDMLHGNGDALLAAVTSAAGSPGLVIPVGTSANFDQLTPGRWVDILTRANGANPGLGLRRKIVTTSRSAGTITVSTTQQASDGNAGNVTFSAAEGVYITGSYGTAMQGLGQAVAITGPFEGVDKALVQQWQGVDATPAATQALSDTLLDNAVYLLRGQGVGASDFGIAHPKTVDLYKAQKAALVKLDPKEVVVPSGFAGIEYQGADRPFPILKDLAAPRGIVRLVTRDAVKLYGDHVGPAFIDDDGTMWRFFSRTLVKEADLLDRVQACFTACNHLATIGNATTQLTEAA